MWLTELPGKFKNEAKKHEQEQRGCTAKYNPYTV